MATDLATVRKELLALARQKSARVTDSTPECPCRWRPLTVKHPLTLQSFTTKMAWEYIVDLLEGVHPLEEIELDKPPGKKGYVFIVPQPSMPPIYIKLQLRNSKIIGRSFHYSDFS